LEAILAAIDMMVMMALIAAALSALLPLTRSATNGRVREAVLES
jgi:hypothetical protein